MIFFWRDIVRIVKAWFGALTGRVPRNDPDARMGWLIIIGSLPIGVLGLLLEDYIDTQFRSLWIVATMLIVFAVFLGLADRFGREQRELKDLTFPSRPAVRLRTGAGTDPGCFSFGRYHYRGSVHGLHP